jgi:hypothetical protein
VERSPDGEIRVVLRNWAAAGRSRSLIMKAPVLQRTFASRSVHDLITQRAGEIWRARGCPTGEDLAIWFDAERDLVRRRLIPASEHTSGTNSDSRLAGASVAILRTA